MTSTVTHVESTFEEGGFFVYVNRLVVGCLRWPVASVGGGGITS